MGPPSGRPSGPPQANPSAHTLGGAVPRQPQHSNVALDQESESASSRTNTRLQPDAVQSDERPVQVQPQDEVDGVRRERININFGFNRSVSTVDDVTQETPGLFTTFLLQRLAYDGIDCPEELARRQVQAQSDVARTLQRIGDELTNNVPINELISRIRVTPDTAYKTFFSVAAQLFSDGTINWGRVVALFYFAYKLAIQCLSNIQLVQVIIDWVVRFVAEKLASWISLRGGWGAVREWFGSTSAQMVGVFLAGMLTAALIYWLKK